MHERGIKGYYTLKELKYIKITYFELFNVDF